MSLAKVFVLRVVCSERFLVNKKLRVSGLYSVYDSLEVAMQCKSEVVDRFMAGTEVGFLTNVVVEYVVTVFEVDYAGICDSRIMYNEEPFEVPLDLLVKKEFRQQYFMFWKSLLNEIVK